MINKIIKIKGLLALFLITAFCMTTMGAVVSDNDGSAFITKAEFDSLKNNFQSQINEYNTSIDSKIDGAIASYLAGLSETKVMDERIVTSELYNIGFYTYPTWYMECVDKNGSFLGSVSGAVWSDTLPGPNNGDFGWDSDITPYTFWYAFNSRVNTSYRLPIQQLRFHWQLSKYADNDAGTGAIWHWNAYMHTNGLESYTRYYGGSNSDQAIKTIRRVVGITTNFGSTSNILTDMMPLTCIEPRNIYHDRVLEMYVGASITSVSYGYPGKIMLYGNSARKDKDYGIAIRTSAVDFKFGSGNSWDTYYSYDYNSKVGVRYEDLFIVRFEGAPSTLSSASIMLNSTLFVTNSNYQKAINSGITAKQMGNFNGGIAKSTSGAIFKSAIFMYPQNSMFIHTVSACVADTFYRETFDYNQQMDYDAFDFILKDRGSITAYSVANMSWSALSNSIYGLRSTSIMLSSVVYPVMGYINCEALDTYYNYALAVHGVEATMTDGCPLFTPTYDGFAHLTIETTFSARKISHSAELEKTNYYSLSRANFGVVMEKVDSSDWLNSIQLYLKEGPFGNVVGNGSTLHITNRSGEIQTSFAENLRPNVPGKPGVFDYYIPVKQGNTIWIKLNPGDWTRGMNCAKVKSVKIITTTTTSN